MSLADESKLGALYLNAKEAVYLWQILEDMGHPEPKTPIKTNNMTVGGIINNKIQPKRTKAMDMQFRWLCDCKAQGQFIIYSRPGGTNLADYFTKHHRPAQLINVRADFSTKVKELAEAWRIKIDGQTKTSQEEIAMLQECVRQARLRELGTANFSEERKFKFSLSRLSNHQPNSFRS